MKTSATIYLPPAQPGDKEKALYVLALLGLPKSHMKVGAVLIWRANRRSGRCDPSVSRIAYDVGIGERSVYQALKALEKADFLTRARYRGGAFTNAYSINWPGIRAKHEAWEAHCASFRHRPDARFFESENRSASFAASIPPLNKCAGVPLNKRSNTPERTCTQTPVKNSIEINSLNGEGEPSPLKRGSPSLPQTQNKESLQGEASKPETPNRREESLGRSAGRATLSRDVRLNKAAQRLDASLRATLDGEAYGDLVDAVPAETLEQATVSEMDMPGSGAPFVLAAYRAQLGHSHVSQTLTMNDPTKDLGRQK